jgi:putative heme transporter
MSENHFLRRNWRLIATVVTFIALAILIIVTRKQIVDTFQNFKNIDSYALLLMIPLQLLNYHAYANLYRSMLRILDEKIGYKSMYRVALELNFVNNVFPSGGVSSFSYFGLRMKSFDVPGTKSTIIQFMKFILVFISFQILLFFGVLALAIGGQASGLVILIAGSLATLHNWQQNSHQ